MRRYPAAVRAAIVALILLLLFVPGARAFEGQGPVGWQPPNQFSHLSDQPRYVVLIIIDGGLPAYLKLADFPHLAALERHGIMYTHAWDGILETETPTGHATIGTGSFPRRHGVLSFSWVTDGDVVEHPTNPIPIQQGQLEDVLHRSGVPSLASLVKQHDRNDQIVVTSGHKDYAVDSVGGWAADYLMYYKVIGQTWAPVAIPRHVPPRSVIQAPNLTYFAPHLYPGKQDSLAVDLAMSAFQQIHQKVTIINLPEFDWPLGHLQGGIRDSWLAWKLMEQFDSDLSYIEWTYAQAHVLNKTLFVVTADHGMLSLNHAVPHASIEQAVAAAGTSLVDYDFHTSGYLWLRDRAKAPEVAANILALHNPLIHAVYYRQPGSYQYIRASNIHRLASPEVDAAYQYLLGTMASPSAPQVVIFLRENSSVLGRNQRTWLGDHGGASWNAEHVPLLFAGAGVRHGVQSTYPATIYDIAPTILALLGIAPHGMDGVPLANAMTDPDLSYLQAQQAQGQELAPLVRALRYQTSRDGR
ncbi:MAG: alkaline phosphatase family protein [Chloroflexota bacterium]|nr:alkaline phosphatase family protein [Chloroflexota bacterium]